MKTLCTLLVATTAIAGVVATATAGERYGDINRFDRADGYGTAHYNADHWILRRGSSDYLRDPRGIPPLTGRTRYGPTGGVFIPAKPPIGTRGNPGGLSLARTYDPVRPSAQVIHVPQELKDLSAAREPGRLARLEREIEDMDIRFRSPTQAYDTRFPSVTYLDAR